MLLLLGVLVWQREVLYNWADTSVEGADLTVADLDGDGDLDIVVCAMDVFDSASAAALAFFYEGGHSFAKDSLSYGAAGLAAGDLDGDGDMDLVLSRSNALKVFFNQGGSWSEVVVDTGYNSYAVDVELADFDGDGDLDILQSREALRDTTQPIEVFENLGGGSFLKHPVAIHVRADGVAIADFDGDGDLDFAVVSGRPDWPGRGVSVYLQNSISSWTERLISSSTNDYDDWYIDAGDVNGDGRPDFITPYSKVYLNQGGANFTELVLANWGHSLTYRYRGGAAFGDLDLDGDLDAVVQVGSENMTVPAVAIFWNDGAGNFSPPETLDTQHRPYISALKVVDINADSCPEIVANGGDEVVIYWCQELGAEEGEYTQKPRLSVGPGLLRITLPGGGKAEVYDATGRLVRSLSCGPGETRVQLKSGVYLVRVKGSTLRAVVP